MSLASANNTTLVVLCGGRGTRLGGAKKPLLIHQDGSTLLERIERALSPHVKARLVVVPEAMAADFATPDRQLVFDQGCGPPAALFQAALTATTEWLLLVGGDHPAPSASLLQVLSTYTEGSVSGVVVEAEGMPQPMFALYRREAVINIGSAPSLMKLLEALKPIRIPEEGLSEDCHQALRDVDTESDVSAFGLRALPSARVKPKI